MSDNNGTIILYMHAGSGNHGCEAIANSLSSLLPGSKVLISYYADEDKKYTLGDLYEIFQERSFNRHKAAHLLYYVYRLATKDRESFIRYRFRQYLNKRNRRYIDRQTGVNKKYPVAISIGGDNYCYDMMLNDLFLTNAAFNAQGTKTVLLGCSIEPEILENKKVIDDLSKYHVIIARESITYDALCEKFKNEGSPAIKLIPDPAFSLKAKRPENIEKLLCHEDSKKAICGGDGKFSNDCVGINISPMIQDNEQISGITEKNYCRLIEYIVDNTDMDVILIPHVVWDRNDDRKPIRQLYEKYKGTGRVFYAEDTDCMELKYLIGKCRFFVGARTHSTIAAYSSCVPTLVVGYSVKARGIAKDIFDTDDTSHYVIPVQSLKNENELTESFGWMMDNEEMIRTRLEKKMPEYIARTGEYSDMI